MKTNYFQKYLASALVLFTLGLATAARGQIVGWVLQTFDYNICGWQSSPAVTLSFDPTQNYPGNGGGSCRVSTDFSAGPAFMTYGDYENCCVCEVHITLDLSNYYSVDFDLKWDNTSTISVSNFNADPDGGAPGLQLGTSGTDFYSPTMVGYTNIIIPDAATNGWVHISAPIDHTLPGPMAGSGIVLEKLLLTNLTGTAAFWLNNVELISSIPATEPFSLTASASAGQITLNWNASPGATYTVQKSLDFIDWTVLTTNYPTGGAPGGSISYKDPSAPGGQAFYRVHSP